MRSTLAFLQAALILGSACTQGAQEREKCSLGTTSEIASVEALGFDEVAIEPVNGGILSAWSSSTGLFTRKLDARGVAVAEPTRIGERCAGGLSLEAEGNGAWLACSAPHDDESESALRLLKLNAQGGLLSTRTLSSVGSSGRGVVLETRAQELLVLWHDAGSDHANVRLAHVRGENVTTELVSQPTVPAFDPDLTVIHGKWAAVFSETRASSLTKSKTRVALRREGDIVRSLREVNVHDPTPRLASDARSMWLTYRALSPRESKPDLFALRLTDRLEATGDPVKIGRANSDGTPRSFACGAEVIALLPREYGGEHYVGVHALDAQFTPLDEGHQLYANSRDYVRASGTCVDGQVVVLAAERAPLTRQSVHAMTARFGCQ